MAKMNKYRVSAPEARTWNGKTYASKAEMEYAVMLHTQLERGQFILDYIEQPRVWLGVRENVYVPDFLVVWADRCPSYIDVKGVETAAFRRNKKLWSRYGRLELQVVKKKGKRFETVEVIHGRGLDEREADPGLSDPGPGRPGAAGDTEGGSQVPEAGQGGG